MAGCVHPDAVRPCKKGPCDKCESLCKRCGCSCNGLNPEQKLQRSVGKRGEGKRTSTEPCVPDEARPLRKSKTTARVLIAENVEHDAEREDAHELLNKEKMRVDALWEFFGLPESRKKKLPSMDIRRNGFVDDISEEVWSSMVLCVHEVAEEAARRIFPNGFKDLLHSAALKVLNANTGDIDRPRQQLKRAAESQISLMYLMPKGSIERRCLRASVVNAFPKALLDSVYNLGNKSRRDSHLDYRTMCQGKRLTTKYGSKEKFYPNFADQCVAFLLRPENICQLSWGVNPVKLSKTEIVTLPSFVRRHTIKTLHDVYERTFQKDRVTRATFYRVVKKVTKKGEKLLAAVDYVTGVLVTDPVAGIQNVIDRFTDGALQESLTHRLEIVANFLKNSKHALLHEHEDAEMVPTHSTKYGLGKGGTQSPWHSKCNACDFMPFFVDQVKSAVKAKLVASNVHSDALQYLDECREKFVLYMGHRMRALNQQEAIREIKESLVNDCLQGLPPRAYLIADWKMKFLVESARELTTEHYGKRGISWHGCALEYYRKKTVVDDNGQEKDIAERVIVYIDQILDGDNKQDVGATASMIEAALQYISTFKSLPQFSEVILQTDNAKCYQSHYFRLLLACINSGNRLKITRHITTETQDGKTVLDGHFGTSERQTTSFMLSSQRNRVKTIATPNGLAYALAWRGGIRNTCVQLVTVNRDKLASLEMSLQESVKRMKKFFLRTNDIFFETDLEERISVTNAETKRALLTFSVQEYSNVSEKITFNCTIGGQVSEIASGQVFVGGEQKVVEHDEKVEEFDEDDDQGPHWEESEEDYEIFEPVKSGTVPDFAFESNDEKRTDQSSDEDDDEEGSADTSDNSDDEESSESDADYTKDDCQYMERKDKSTETVTGVRVWKSSGLGKISAHQRKKPCMEQPRGEVIQERRDIVAYCVRKARELCDTHVVNVRDAQGDLEEYVESRNTPTESRPQGWARRPKHGSQYGVKYLPEYADVIRNYFNKGAESSAEKLSAASMYLCLRRDHPDVFRLPSESEIKSEISSLFQRSKKMKGDAAAGAVHGVDNRRIVPQVVEDRINGLLQANPESTTEGIMRTLKDEFGENISNVKGGFLTRQQLSNKINNIKAKLTR